MRMRKPNRVTTAKRSVLNGARTSHASMPRTRGRWRPGSARLAAPADDPGLLPGAAALLLPCGGCFQAATPVPSRGKPEEAP